MELRNSDNSPRRRPPGENTPTVTVLFGDGDSATDVGLVKVRIPAGGGMPSHRHGGSDVILTPLTGHVSIADGTDSVDVRTGDSVLIRKDEEVSLRNPGDEPAEVLVSVAPTNFVTGILQWPPAQ